MMSLDCRDGQHVACSASGSCDSCWCHTIRPTQAQVSVHDDLIALSASASAAQAVAVSIADEDTAREVVLVTRSLASLVAQFESWVDPALAHIAVSAPLIENIRRRGEPQ